MKRRSSRGFPSALVQRCTTILLAVADRSGTIAGQHIVELVPAVLPRIPQNREQICSEKWNWVSSKAYGDTTTGRAIAEVEDVCSRAKDDHVKLDEIPRRLKIVVATMYQRLLKKPVKRSKVVVLMRFTR
ncbi:NAD(P)-binding Rossmann-fold superfamily protein [Striga asiatica]|uniref:NAD(P)-binding Rossmann-fold superfamily protein n=1 Tax=Striga asiatica TaxID=4170 RepID=A0A5A7QUS3_STRAF|nr:NAD(P)-binding Rossmann-fold superfamily protein [Striga asiatica]